MAAAANPIVEQDLAHIVRAGLPWESLSGATVLVTGGAGFLPAYMVETLMFLNRNVLAEPARVIVLARNARRARDRFASAGIPAELEIVEQDVVDPLTFRGALDYVIHAASQAHLDKYVTDPVGTLGANVLGTHNLLTAAHRSHTRAFLFFSSGAAYGDISERSEPVAEHDMGILDPADERACYAESKRMGETMCVAWARQFGLPTRIVRPWHTYGPGMRLDDGRVFADFVRDIVNGGPIVLRSSGEASRCFCYIADAVRGFFTVLLRGGAGDAYNVANPKGECCISELADRLAALYRHEGVTVVRTATDGAASTRPAVRVVPNIAKLEALGWTPERSIEDGFRRTVDSYRVVAPPR
jgi:UDP-glucuronate decarboxylase